MKSKTIEIIVHFLENDDSCTTNFWGERVWYFSDFEDTCKKHTNTHPALIFIKMEERETFKYVVQVKYDFNSEDKKNSTKKKLNNDSTNE